MQKILFISLIAVFIVFYTQLQIGSGGYMDDKAVIAKIKAQQVINQGLIKRNRDVGIKITDLKGSNDALETRARYELNLIKPGEILVVLPNDNESITVQPMQR